MESKTKERKSREKSPRRTQKYCKLGVGLTVPISAKIKCGIRGKWTYGAISAHSDFQFYATSYVYSTTFHREIFQSTTFIS